MHTNLHIPASRIIMVRNTAFGYNPQTASTNRFQHEQERMDFIREFDTAVSAIQNVGIDALVVDKQNPEIPDAIFPNNWLVTLPDGVVIICPMQAPNRRMEIDENIIETLMSNYRVNQLIDLRSHADRNNYLEGTGSIVFDHQHKKAYACISPRTSPYLFNETCERIGYDPVSFISTDENGTPIYHTNVMLAIGEQEVVICDESIEDPIERNMLLNQLKENHTVVRISRGQMRSFCGNMIQLKGATGNMWVMSDRAKNALRSDQLEILEGHSVVIAPAIPSIELIGGGGIRCMIAENFLLPQ